MDITNSWAGHWQDNTLYLPEEMTIKKLDGITLESPVFPSSHCTIDASKLQQVDSIGVAALISLRAFADEHQVQLTWQSLPKVLTNLLDLYDINSEEMIK